MNTSKRSIIICLTVVLSLGLAALCVRLERRPTGSGVTGLFRRTPPVVPPVEVIAAQNIDERLFLVRLLSQFYAQWPTDASQPEALQKYLGELRYRANRRYLDIKDRKLDETIESLYSDYISAIDSHMEFLAKIGRIQSDAVARAEKESTESGFNAGYHGGEFAAGLSDDGASGFDSFLGGAALSAISYLWDDYNKGKVRDADKQRAITAATQDLQNRSSIYMARTQNAAIKLETKYSWQRGEAGFDESTEQTEVRQNLAKANDIAGLIQVAARELQKRPRDPFVRWRKAYYSSIDSRATPKDMVLAAGQCVEAAAFVPDGRIYDDYRGWFLHTAGDIANRSSTKEIGNRSWATAYNSTAAYAVRLWDAYLKFAPNDPTGECRERRAWALMQSGHLQEALEQASSVEALRKNTQKYSYNLACLLSSMNDTDGAYKWLDHAIRDLGYINISEVKKDEDLEFLRREQNRKFTDLTMVKWRWNIEFGFLNDDVIVQNDSAFAITNVVFKGNFTSGGRSWTPELKVKRIDPGKACKWPNVFSIPGSKVDSTSTASISTDQGS